MRAHRVCRAFHDFTPSIVIPAAVTHVVALLLDATARVGLFDAFVPFQMSYGQLAIGLGTVSLVTMFLHAILSGTDLAAPAISALSWAAAIGIGYYTLERVRKALRPAGIGAQGLH